jgi:deoxyribodipyrimidine photo-lyase
MAEQVAIFWFRRDLRLNDNSALYHALRSGFSVVPVFIFDKNILDDLQDKDDRRVNYIYNALLHIQDELHKCGSGLDVRYGYPEKIFTELLDEYKVSTVFTNHDYEPYAIERDQNIEALLRSKNVVFKTFKDQVIFEKSEVAKKDGTPYFVFTPYSKTWLHKLSISDLIVRPSEILHDNYLKQKPIDFPTLKEIGFIKNNDFPSVTHPSESLLTAYHETRNFPGVEGTSKVSVHLRFGTLSIRQLVNTAKKLNEVYVKELIWREFYMQLLWHFPRLQHQAFKVEYEKIKWRNNEGEFKKWCDGETGYAIVDAGMRELNATGFMHNRVRMVVASFLVKHLLIDWRWGEAYFARKLLDYELASNNGNWQWAAGCGCDAAPYFRIFNPYIQAKKFDKDLVYIKKWVPEFNDLTYTPIVDHKKAVERCLQAYKTALDKSNK